MKTIRFLSLCAVLIVIGVAYLVRGQAYPPNGVVYGDARYLTNLPAGHLTGTMPNACIPSSVDGIGITNLQGSNLVGQIPESSVSNLISDLASKMLSSQTFAFTGDATGSGNTSTALTLAAVATPGTSTKVTYDAKGRVTSGTVLSKSDIPNIDESQVNNLTSDLASKLSSLPAGLAYLGSNQTFTAPQTVAGTFTPSGNTNESVYATGGTLYTITTTSTAVTVNGTAITITFRQSGRYLLMPVAQMYYNGVTIGSTTATFKLRKTSGTAADIPNSTVTAYIPALTLVATQDYGSITFPSAIEYQASAGDVISIFASVANAPTLGSLQVKSASIYAYHFSN